MGISTKIYVNMNTSAATFLILSLAISNVLSCNPGVPDTNPFNVGGEGSISMKCSGSVSSSCYGTLCTVECSDGNKVELDCDTQTVGTGQEGDDVSVQCGTEAPECFPFC